MLIRRFFFILVPYTLHAHNEYISVSLSRWNWNIIKNINTLEQYKNDKNIDIYVYDLNIQRLFCWKYGNIYEYTNLISIFVCLKIFND